MKTTIDFRLVVLYLCALLNAPTFGQNGPNLIESSNFISATNNVYPNITYKFQVQNIPSSWTVTSYEWEVSQDASIIVNGSNMGMNFSSPHQSSIEVIFTDTYPAGFQSLKVTIHHEEQGIHESSTLDRDFDELNLLTIPTTLYISGKNKLSECCREPETYELKQMGDADNFSWNFPSQWIQITQSSGGKMLKVKPDKLNGGPVKVEASISSHPIPGAYKKTALLQVSRHPATFKIKNIPDRPLCPFTSYTITYDPICGATSYQIDLPNDWTLGTSVKPSGEEPGSVNFKPSRNGIIGNPGSITITANFEGCSPVTATLPFAIAGEAPQSTPVIEDFNYTFFHCGKWQICPEYPGRIRLGRLTENTIEYIEWEIKGPYHFVATGSKYYKEIIPPFISPRHYNAEAWIAADASALPHPGNATLRARFGNCYAPASKWSNVTIYEEEDSEWCAPNYPYPAWCECCDPNSDPFPKSSISEQEGARRGYSIYPNPGVDQVLIVRPTAGRSKLEIISATDNKIIQQQKLEGYVNNVGISGLPPGLFIFRIIESDGLVKTFKFLKNSQL